MYAPLGIIVVGILVATYGYSPALLGQTTVNNPTTGYYSVCDITGQVGVVITGCQGQISGSLWLVFVNYNGACNAVVPTFTAYWPGQAGVASTSGFTSFTPPVGTIVETMQFTITGPGVNAAGTVTINAQSGNSTFTDNFTNQIATCSTSTTSSSSSATTQSTSTSQCMTNCMPPVGFNPDNSTLFFLGVLIAVIGVVMEARRKG